jgi:hypothetical protein
MAVIPGACYRQLVYPAKNRRKFPRVPFPTDAVVYAEKRRLSCRCVDLSVGGMKLIPPAKANRGLPMRLSFQFPGKRQSLSLMAMLIREGSHDQRYVWGVRFFALPPSVEPLIGRFVDEELARLDELERQRTGISSANYPAVDGRDKRRETIDFADSQQRFQTGPDRSSIGEQAREHHDGSEGSAREQPLAHPESLLIRSAYESDPRDAPLAPRLTSRGMGSMTTPDDLDLQLDSEDEFLQLDDSPSNPQSLDDMLAAEMQQLFERVLRDIED